MPDFPVKILLIGIAMMVASPFWLFACFYLNTNTYFTVIPFVTLFFGGTGLIGGYFGPKIFNSIWPH
jgi:hypothetical protein